jgi:hypothetical protein
MIILWRSAACKHRDLLALTESGNRTNLRRRATRLHAKDYLTLIFLDVVLNPWSGLDLVGLPSSFVRAFQYDYGEVASPAAMCSHA